MASARLKRVLLALVAATVLAGALAAVVLQRAWTTLNAPFRGYAGAERIVVIPPGLGGAAVLALLQREGVLPETRWTRAYLVHRLGDPALLAGEYRFRGPLSPLQVLGIVQRGEVATHPVTVVEGLTLAETIAALASAGVADPESLRATFGRPDLIADLDPLAADLEGYLFPETYHFRRAVTASEVAATMVRTFRRRYLAAAAPARPSDDRRSLRELVTLASLVEKEAKRDDERPLIAAVYANRLRLGMTLGADPTIIHGLKLAGRWDGNLRRADLEADSPWNSYRRTGLPPTPICSPGLASLAAAAAPAASPALFFVSRNDGSHVFSRTLAEHERAVDRWQRRYWRERRSEGR